MYNVEEINSLHDETECDWCAVPLYSGDIIRIDYDNDILVCSKACQSHYCRDCGSNDSGDGHADWCKYNHF